MKIDYQKLKNFNLCLEKDNGKVTLTLYLIQDNKTYLAIDFPNKGNFPKLLKPIVRYQEIVTYEEWCAEASCDSQNFLPPINDPIWEKYNHGLTSKWTFKYILHENLICLYEDPHAGKTWANILTPNEALIDTMKDKRFFISSILDVVRESKP